MLIYYKQTMNVCVCVCVCVCVSDTHKYKGNKVLNFSCFLT